MAGSIIIGPKNSVALNTFGFDLIVSAIRKELENSAPDIVEAIFDPLDAGGMPFISVDSSDAKAFVEFYDAAKNAFAEWKRNNKGSFPEWQELIEKLEADERFRGTPSEVNPAS